MTLVVFAVETIIGFIGSWVLENNRLTDMSKLFAMAVFTSILPLTYSLHSNAEEYNSSLSIGISNQVSSNGIGSGAKGAGINFKAITQKATEPIGIVFSYTSTSDTVEYAMSSSPLITANLDYKYLSFMVGPSYDLNDRATIYGLIGSSRAKAKINKARISVNDNGVAYGVGLRYRIYNNFVIDAHYENTTMGSAGGSGTYSMGLGYILK